MPICDVQLRPQVMQLKMFTVGFDAQLLGSSCVYDDHSSSERSERFVRFELNVRSERVRYFSERETNGSNA